MRIGTSSRFLLKERDMNAGQLSFEQESSLVKRLEAAGIRHGDTAEVTLEGVGVRATESGVPSVAFCPSSVLDARILKYGSRCEHKQEIPARVQVSKNLQRRILNFAPEHGFVRLQLLVHSNGVLQLNGRVTKAEPVSNMIHVHGTDSYRMYKKDGQLQHQ